MAHDWPPAAASVRPIAPNVMGMRSPESIRRVVRRNVGQLLKCDEQGLAQDRALRGRVVVRFIIGGDGSVLASNVVSSTLSLPSVSTCMANAIRRWQFPAPEGGGIVAVNHPFEVGGGTMSDR